MTASQSAFGAPDMACRLRSLLVSLNLFMAGARTAEWAHAARPPGAGKQRCGCAGACVFSDTGPDAAPTARRRVIRPAPRRPPARIEHLVNTYSHFGEMFPSRQVRRATTPWLFKRAAEPAISYKFESEQRSITDYLGQNPDHGPPDRERRH